MSRRSAAVLLALAVLVPACSGDDDADRGREIAHAAGTTRVPDEPVRVVVLDAASLDNVTALGITPVGAPRAERGAEITDYVTDALGPGAATIADVGTDSEVDLTAVAAVRPDLVLSSRRHEGLYALLSAIAPTVLTESSGASWKADFLLDAEALGRRDAADAVLAAYDARVREVTTAYGTPSSLAVRVVRFVPEPRLYDQGSFVGTVLADVGFSQPAATPAGFTDLDPGLVGLRGDVLLTSGYLAAGVRASVAAQRTPQWRALSAVRAGRSVEVTDDLWFLATGPVGAQLVLDDLEGFAPRLTRR